MRVWSYFFDKMLEKALKITGKTPEN